MSARWKWISPQVLATEDGREILTVTEALDLAKDPHAALLEAAPEMLAALKGVVRVADRKTDEFDAARAAIAKAEGRT